MPTMTILAKKPNIGVFTNPKHDLWLEETEPSVEAVRKGEGLKDGEVTIAIKSTGICGFAFPCGPASMQKADCCPWRLVPTSTFGTQATLALW